MARTCPVCGVPYEEGATRCNNVNCRGCFAEGTSVLTSRGWKSIELLNPGDTVYSYDTSSPGLSEQTVVRRKSYCNAQVLSVMTHSHPDPILVTRLHTLRTVGEWKRAGRLSVGDELFDVDERGNVFRSRVVAIEAMPDRYPVHNLVATGPNNFIVPGCLAHSFTYFRSLRGAITNLLHSSQVVRHRAGRSGKTCTIDSGGTFLFTQPDSLPHPSPAIKRAS